MTRRIDVQRTYDQIAHHFSKTREKPWEEVVTFLTDREVDTALDIGCGNGRHAEVMADHATRVIGIDFSAAALTEAYTRAVTNSYDFHGIIGDAAALPICTSSVDLAVYIATIHHLPTRALRLESLDELSRILTGDGVALVSAWSTSHKKFQRAEGFDTMIDWILPTGERVPRFYHIYDEDEFKRDIVDSDLDLVEIFMTAGNCYAVVGK